MAFPKNILAVILIIGIIVSCGQTNTSKTELPTPSNSILAEPASLGFSLDSLKKIDDMILKYVDMGFIPGASILVARHGKIAYETVGGWRDREEGIPMEKDDIFRLASMTKPIISAAVLQLYEQGKLNVNDPISKYIPEFANPTVLESVNETDTTWSTKPAEREITIRHLLTHTSGIAYGFANPKMGMIYKKLSILDGANPLDMTIEQTMARLGKAPLLFDPGTGFEYGLNTDVLGRVVEVASGKALNLYIKENILDKLGMQDTWFFSKDTIEEKLATCYIPLADTAITKRNDELIKYPIRGAKKYFSGGSGLSGNARDYFTFCQAILNKGKLGDVRILRDSTVKLMRTNQIDTISFPWGPGKFGYGYHVQTEDHENKDLGRKGKFRWGGIFHTTFWVDPDRDIIAILMSQVQQNPNGNKINTEFETLVNRALVDERK
ncbi:MAG: beta-lactamase family protein [Cyclobacteriaceae bacterium]